MKIKKIYIYSALALLCCIFIAIGIYMSSSFEYDEYELTPTVSEEVELNEDKQANVALVEYSVYDLNDLEFGFIIARIRIQKLDADYSINLSDLTTDEGIHLDELSDFTNQLILNNYYLVKQNVSFDIDAKEESYMLNIFIPYEDKALDELTVNIDLTQNQLVFDLTDATTDGSALYYKSDDVITDGATFEMVVSDAIEITGDEITRTYDDGYSEVYQYPSTAQVYAFKVTAVSLDQDTVEIEEAMYEVEGSGDVFVALNEQFKSMKYDNIIGQVISEEGSGTLLFMALNPDQEPIKYTGRLKIKLVGSDEWISIYVDL
ncbi:MAG: hypothetical protein R3Y57_05245 [Erysipelotrichaceae bacterium]